MPVSPSHGRGEPSAILFDALGHAAHASSRRRRTCARRCASAPGVDIGDAGGRGGDPRRDRLLPRPPARGRATPAALHDLRVRCAEAMARCRASPRERRSTRCWPRCASTPTPTARRRCARCATRGIRTVVVSNWDCVAARAPAPRPGWRRSSTARSPRPRSARPSPTARSSRAALELAGTTPADAWHVGDTPEADVEGARAAGHPPDPDRPRRAGRAPPGVPRSDRWPSSYPWRCPDDERRASRRLPERSRRAAAEAPARSRSGRRSRRCSPCWSSSASSAPRVLSASLTASDPSIKSTDDLPDGATLALTFFQDLVFVFRRVDRGQARARARARRADFGLRRVRSWREALKWAGGRLRGLLARRRSCSRWSSATPTTRTLVTDLKEEDSLGIADRLRRADLRAGAGRGGDLLPRLHVRRVRCGAWPLVWAALLDGVVFGLGHAPAAPIQLIALGAFGVGLCLLYWRTQSIIPCMALHALNNSITFGAAKDLDAGAVRRASWSSASAP